MNIHVHGIFEATGERVLLRRDGRLIPLVKGEKLVVFLTEPTTYYVLDGLAFLQWPGETSRTPWANCSVEAGCEVTLKPPVSGGRVPSVSKGDLPDREISLAD